MGVYLNPGNDGFWKAEDEKTPMEQEFSVVDSYLENYREVPRRRYSSHPAYRLEGNYLPLGTGQVLHGYVNTNELKKVCHGYGVSITKYLAAVLVWSIWQEYLDGKPWTEPVVLNLPINLRAFFASETMANFFAVTMIGHLFRNPDISFETLLGKISRQMDRKIDKKRLEESISYNVSREKKWYLRVIPLVLKSLALNLVFWMKDRAYTMTLSNIGVIKVEPEQEKEIERVGGSGPREVDVRIIAATNRDLNEAMNMEEFRRDLYHRLAVLKIHIPPLRERREDIPELCSLFLEQCCRKSNRPRLNFSPEAHLMLLGYSYPGNIRELESIIEQAVNSAPIDCAELDSETLASIIDGELHCISLANFREIQERWFIQQAIKLYNGDIQACSKALDVHPRTIRRRLSSFNID